MALTALPNVKRFTTYTAADLIARPPAPFVIEGVLPAGSLGVLGGQPGSLKTFIALSMALSIACGAPWHGSDVQQGGVLFISAEGGAGIGPRIAAWQQAHYREVPDTFRVITD